MVKYQIQINEPCSEDWHKMTNLEKGKFCDSCKKQVFDFTQFSNIELARKINKGDNVCGRFEKKQVNRVLALPETSSFNRFRYIFSFSAFLFSTPILISQNSKQKIENLQIKDINQVNRKSDSILIKGKVVDNVGDVLPGTSIYLRQTNTSYKTDFDGVFSFHVDKKLVNKSFSLSIAFIGFKYENVIVNKHNYNNLRIELKEDDILMGEVVIVETKEVTLFSWIGNLFKKKNKKKPECKNAAHKHKP